MTYTTIPEATVAAIGNLAPEAKATAREQLAKHYPADAVEKAFGAATAAPMAAPAQSSPVIGNNPDAAIGYDDRVKGFAALYKHGSPSMQATVLAQAKAAGVPLDKITGGAVVPPELLTRDQRADAANVANDPMGVPNDPAGYDLRFDQGFGTDMDIGDLAKLDSQYREAFFTASIPKVSAQGILDGVFDARSLYPEGMTDAARELMHREQGAILIRAHGQQAAEAILADATAAYNRLPAAFRKMVDDQHGFHSAKAQLALAQAERAYHARKGS